jgi:hypothetical protein
MKPAPATAARATSAFGGSAARIACASSRGLRRAAFASRSAILLAKSPCCASRVRSTMIASRCAALASDSSPMRARALRRSSSRCCFTSGSPAVQGDAVYQRGPARIVRAGPRQAPSAHAGCSAAAQARRSSSPRSGAARHGRRFRSEVAHGGGRRASPWPPVPVQTSALAEAGARGAARPSKTPAQQRRSWPNRVPQRCGCKAASAPRRAR